MNTVSKLFGHDFCLFCAFPDSQRLEKQLQQRLAEKLSSADLRMYVGTSTHCLALRWFCARFHSETVSMKEFL